MSRLRELREYVRLARIALGPEVVLQPPVEELSSPPRIEVWISGPGGDTRQYAHISFVKDLVRRAASQYQMHLPSVMVRFSSAVGRAGSVQRRGEDWFIDVGTEYQKNTAQLMYIVAHEMAHVLLAKRGVSLSPVQRNEELTDTVTVLAGFGPIVWRAMELVKSHRTWEIVDGRYAEVLHTKSTKIGYLSRTDVSTLSHVRRRLRDVRLRERRYPVDTRLRSSLLCPCCRVRLRLPEVTGVVLIRCKMCRGEQTVRLERSETLVAGLLFSARHLPRWLRDRRAGFPD